MGSAVESAIDAQALSDFLWNAAAREPDPDTSNLLLQAKHEAKALEDEIGKLRGLLTEAAAYYDEAATHTYPSAAVLYGYITKALGGGK